MMQTHILDFFDNPHAPHDGIIVVRNAKEAKLACDALLFLGLHAFELPDIRTHHGDDLRSWNEELFYFNTQLRKFYQTTHRRFLIIPAMTLTLPMPSEKALQTLTLSFGETLHLSSFKTTMLYWGYTFVDLVEQHGEISIRGDIIDIFPPHETEPFRLSLFDDQIESIRTFSIETQKSILVEHESCLITPAFYSLLAEEFDTLSLTLNRLYSSSLFCDIPSRGLWHLQGCHSFTEYPLFSPFSRDDFIDELGDARLLDLIEHISFIPPASRWKELSTSNINALRKTHPHKKLTLLARNEALIKQCTLDNFNNVQSDIRDLYIMAMNNEHIIYSLNNPHRTTHAKKVALIVDELRTGQYVVHENYGIGIFEGLQAVNVLGGTRDFVSITYQNDDKLLVPVENIELLDRYIADSGSLPTLDKLGKSSFAKLKENVRQKLFEMAQDIIALAAQRQQASSYIIQPELTLIKQFQDSASFEYTPDQTKAIDEILNDFKSGMIMDRLLSGDVGFGKTEVALNAVYATFLSGYQSIIIVPTTILSHQHFLSFQERLSPFGLKVARIDRYISSKEKKEVLQQFHEGSIDILVGTHALLEVTSPKLGFVVIDEEHKFGVKQKEKIKELSTHVHLLFMSATPIPRSLNLALSQVKGLSTITTPPQMREGVRTFVREYDDALIKEVIERERRRGGQIFYVHNRIASIEAKKNLLEKLIPHSRILTLHSEISPATTEEELIKFVKGEYDILVSTSIIESGINMPRVNTILIDGADRFGLADLHQLRGRVGRGDKMGYCYFLVKDKDKLTPESTKRLAALEANQALGSGSVLAYHDLEIRGGGNILGEAQSGHIKGIGYGLYLKMLQNTLNELQGNTTTPLHEVELKLTITAYLSHQVIEEERLRLELYRRFGQCHTIEEVYALEGEMRDRFGVLDTITSQFIELMVIKVLATHQQFKVISNYGQHITLTNLNNKNIQLLSPTKDDDDILLTLKTYFLSLNNQKS